jgi:hypothetical protein
VLLSLWSKVLIDNHIDLRPHQPIDTRIEVLLRICPCGGNFRHSASPRCPACNELLSPIAAKKYTERNAPGAKSGWHWQNSWDGIYSIIINNLIVHDWWDEHKLENLTLNADR